MMNKEQVGAETLNRGSENAATDHSAGDCPIVLNTLNAFNEQFRENPWPLLEQVRSMAVPPRDESGYVLLTHAADVDLVLRDKTLWSDPRKALPGSPYSLLVRPGDLEPSMLLSDDPRHKRLRGLVSQAFTPKSVEKWRARTAQIAAELLEDTEDAFDLIAGFAGPLPTIVISEMLGVDLSLRGWFKQHSDATAYAFFNPFCTEDERNAGVKGGEELNAYFAEQIEQRRVHQGEDLISGMIAAQLAGDSFTDEEIIGQCNLLLIAGNITTTDLVGNGVQALLAHRDQWELLCAQPELAAGAVEELLRFCTPVTNSGRIASADSDISGCPIHKGENYSLSLAAANRDPEIVDRPNELDITRNRVRHWSFGGGRHFCLGAPLARMEGQEALLALTRSCPQLQLVEGQAKRRSMPGFSGYLQLGVRKN